MNLGGMVRAGMERMGMRPATPAQTPAQTPAPTGGSAVADLVQQRYRYARQAKESMLETWATCLAFYTGDQWRNWDKQKRQLVQPNKIPSWRVLPVYNQLPGVVDMASAKLSRAQQLPRCRPDEPQDQADQQRAQLGTQALRGWWHHEDMVTYEHEANVSRIILGSAGYHLYWDPNALAKISVPDLATGRSRAEYAPVGQLLCEVLTPFDLFPEPVEQWRDASWCIIARRKPLAWFKATFGPAAEGVEPDKGDYDSTFSGLIPGLEDQFGQSTGAPEGEGLATLLICYERPCRDYPQGRTIYVSGERELFSLDSLPLPHTGLRNPLPVKLSGYRHVPKRLWPKGLIEECISPQRELNRGLGNLQEWMRLHRGAKWLVPKGTIDSKAITSAPDEVVEYKPGTSGGKPEMVPPAPMPGWISQYPGIQREELRQVAGQHEVSEGQVPTNVTAASAIQLLQQADNARLSSPALLGAKALEDLARHALCVFDERYREQRVVSVPGRGGSAESALIQGGQFGPLEVVVELSEGVEDNDAVRQQQLSDWLGVGLMDMLAGPMAPIILQLLRDIGLGWIADIVERELPAIQAEQAAQQQAAMAQQQSVAEQEQGAAAEQQMAAAQEAEAQRQHEREMAGASAEQAMVRQALQGQQQMAVARARMGAGR